jgi:hypothetical protein
MPAPRQPTRDTFTAQVFLRSASGRSLGELGEAADLGDLASFTPPVAARAAAIGRFEELGFHVFADEMGIALTIEAAPAVFTRAFGVSSVDLRKASAADTIRLRVPAGLGDTVEEILLLPPPELHES